MRFLRVFQFVLLMVLAGCQGRSVQEMSEPARQSGQAAEEASFDSESLRSVSWSEIPPELFADGMIDTWADALTQSALYYRRVAPDKKFQFGTLQVSAVQMHKATLELAELARTKDPVKLQNVLQERYRLFRAAGGNSKGNVLVTGYYEPLLHGSKTPSARYRYPIYRRPPDLVDGGSGQGAYRLEKGKRVSYYTRAQIDEPVFRKAEPKPARKPPARQAVQKGGKKSKAATRQKPAPKQKAKPAGALSNRGLELVWVDNVIDAFFLHIQGSGRVRMDDGRMMRIGYDGTNGRTYTAIGRILIEEKKIPHEEMTMPRLRQWLQEHPGEQQRIFFANPSYVFFRELSGDAVGNINVPLTRDRSIATDHRLFPRGAPGILATTLPNMGPDGKTVTGWRPEMRFVVNQDTGGAIRGAGRVDLFFGFGELIEYPAGVMKQNGSRLYFIAPHDEQS